MKSQELHTTEEGARTPSIPTLPLHALPQPIHELVPKIIPPMLSPKKSRRTLILLISIVVFILAAAGTGYYFLSTNTADAPIETVAPVEPIDPAVEAVTKSLTDSFNQENTLTDVDDRNEASRASTDVTAVGGSIDENDI